MHGRAVMANGFDKFGFLGMLYGKYHCEEEPMLAELIENVVYDAYTTHNTSKDQLVLRLADMLPDLSFGEVAQFVDDSCLSEWGKAEKREWREAYK